MGRSNTYKWVILVGIISFILIAPYFLKHDANYIDISSIGGVSPGVNGHLLGTDTIGRDVLAGIISGARISFTIALISLIIALILGFLFNLPTSYVGDGRIKLNVIQCIVIFISLFFLYFYLFVAFSPSVYLSIFIIALYLLGLRYVLPFLNKIGKPFIHLPMDTIGQKVYELFRAVPKLILLLIFIGLSPKNNVWVISLVLGFLMWPLFFRYIRIEILSEKGKERFSSLKNLGYSDLKIIASDFLPTMIPILTTPFIFAFVSVIFLEANLSFLGLGMSDEVTWGVILAEAKRNTSAWWLILFPGICLFCIFFFLDRWLVEEDRSIL